MTWIPTTERTPRKADADEHRDVLCRYKTGKVAVVPFTVVKRWRGVHWMPIPKLQTP